MVGFDYTAHGSDPDAIMVDCSVDVTSDDTTFAQAQVLSFAEGGCSSGYSRAFNAGCQTYCGCRNTDGTPKVQCDWCCMSDSYCHREKGPTSNFTLNGA